MCSEELNYVYVMLSGDRSWCIDVYRSCPLLHPVVCSPEKYNKTKLEGCPEEGFSSGIGGFGAASSQLGAAGAFASAIITYLQIETYSNVAISRAGENAQIQGAMAEASGPEVSILFVHNLRCACVINDRRTTGGAGSHTIALCECLQMHHIPPTCTTYKLPHNQLVLGTRFRV